MGSIHLSVVLSGWQQGWGGTQVMLSSGAGDWLGWDCWFVTMSMLKEMGGGEQNGRIKSLSLLSVSPAPVYFFRCKLEQKVTSTSSCDGDKAEVAGELAAGQRGCLLGEATSLDCCACRGAVCCCCFLGFWGGCQHR